MYSEFFTQLSTMTSLLSDEELSALAANCEGLIKDRERIKRNELRQELMENLQKAIGDILHNGFELYIKNTNRDENDGCEDVYFETEDIYHIEIE